MWKNKIMKDMAYQIWIGETSIVGSSGPSKDLNINGPWRNG
jgi:hypothetical protein